MTELFKQRVAAFQMFLDFPGPYAVSIRTFMRDVLRRLRDGLPLEKRQAELLLTLNPVEIQKVFEQWASFVEASSLRIHSALIRGDVGTAFDLCQSWGDSYWRHYQYVIDMYVFEGNPYLQTPYEASKSSEKKLLAAFPVNIHTSEDPLEGRLEHFEEQLRQYGNPWK